MCGFDIFGFDGRRVNSFVPGQQPERQQSHHLAARTILALGGSANTVPLSYKILSFPKHRSTHAGVLLCFMQIRTDGPPH